MDKTINLNITNLKGFLNISDDNETTEIIEFNRLMEAGPGFAVIGMTFCSVTTCLVVMIMLLKSRSGNFFTWKILDRFTLYNAVGDLMLYTAQVAYGVHTSVKTRIDEKSVSGLPCTIHAIFILEFAFAQIFFGVMIAIYAFVLVYKNRHISLGKYDLGLHIPLFGIPLIVLVIAAYFDQFEPNPIYCGFKEEQGFLTGSFFANFLFIMLSFVIIVFLYLTLWCFVHKKRKENEATLGQSSAVNTRRLAFKLSLYVATYCIQFCGYLVEGMWVSFTKMPAVARYLVIMVGASGGIINGIVYLTIRRG